MSKLPFKKRLVITSNQELDNEASLNSQESSVKSLGSFRLRFKSGGTNKTKPGRDTATATPDANLQAEISMDTIHQNVPESSQPEASIEVIPKARQTEILSEESIKFGDIIAGEYTVFNIMLSDLLYAVLLILSMIINRAISLQTQHHQILKSLS